MQDIEAGKKFDKEVLSPEMGRNEQTGDRKATIQEAGFPHKEF
ncbi:MAG: hypothetical protein QME78_05900 [Thermodesulfobacteriota bacterium]|nr:hypothetical protein [Thermodesulfobacteriota bacterium]